ncbi:MAG: sigma factor [Pirellulales bacterium]
MDAIDAFDTTRGVKFETYCVPRIRGAMLDELRSMDWVPRLVRSKASARRGQEAARNQVWSGSY